MNKSTAILLILAAVGILSLRTSLTISMSQNCTGFLKQAADANSVEIAKEQLNKSIMYLENKKLTTGYTSILWKTPDEDIGFWYNNLKSSYNELSKVTDSTSSLEKTNLLMKLRETLIDNGQKGDHLTIPDGLARYPDNLLWAFITFICISVIAFNGMWLFGEYS